MTTITNIELMIPVLMAVVLTLAIGCSSEPPEPQHPAPRSTTRSASSSPKCRRGRSYRRKR